MRRRKHRPARTREVENGQAAFIAEDRLAVDQAWVARGGHLPTFTPAHRSPPRPHAGRVPDCSATGLSQSLGRTSGSVPTIANSSGIA